MNAVSPSTRVSPTGYLKAYMQRLCGIVIEHVPHFGRQRAWLHAIRVLTRIRLRFRGQCFDSLDHARKTIAATHAQVM